METNSILETPIKKGTVVLYTDTKDGGHYRVTAVYKNTVNLSAVFGSKVLLKSIPLSKVKENEENWYKGWTQSETYMCM